MSEWRRLALEAMPSCKLIIDAADNPLLLWIDLAHEVRRSLEKHADTEASGGKADDIFRFAALCDSSPKIGTLYEHAGEFFAAVAGGGDRALEGLTNYVSPERFYSLLLDNKTWYLTKDPDDRELKEITRRYYERKLERDKQREREERAARAALNKR